MTDAEREAFAASVREEALDDAKAIVMMQSDAENGKFRWIAESICDDIESLKYKG